MASHDAGEALLMYAGRPQFQLVERAQHESSSGDGPQSPDHGTELTRVGPPLLHRSAEGSSDVVRAPQQGRRVDRGPGDPEPGRLTTRIDVLPAEHPASAYDDVRNVGSVT